MRLQHHENITGPFTGTCAAIVHPSEKKVVYLMLRDRCGPQQGEEVSLRNQRSQSDMATNSCSLLFPLKSSPAAGITLSFLFGPCGIELQHMMQDEGQQQLQNCQGLSKQPADVIILKNLQFSA